MVITIKHKNTRKYPLPALGACVLLLAIVLIGATIWLIQSGRYVPEPGDQSSKILPTPFFIALEPMTVNLKKERDEQFLQTAITVEVTNQSQVERIKSHLPHIRSRLLLLMSEKKASDISSLDGKLKLLEEIRTQVTHPFEPLEPPQEVKAIFFTTFVIQ